MVCVEFGCNVVGLEDVGFVEINFDVINNIIDLMVD